MSKRTAVVSYATAAAGIQDDGWGDTRGDLSRTGSEIWMLCRPSLFGVKGRFIHVHDPDHIVDDCGQAEWDGTDHDSITGDDDTSDDWVILPKPSP